jgi:predicted transport protein
LPVLETENSKNRYGKYSGNADNFLGYVSSEVIPYINANYRTLNHNMVVGHSLGASFILYSLLEKPNLFENYIAISPNLAYDEDKLGRALTNFDYKKIKKPTFIYLSNANEGIEYWKEWKPAREQVYSFFQDSLTEKNITVEIENFPDDNHWSTFPPSLNKALEFYFKNIQNKQDIELSKEENEVTIKVKVPKKEDTIYITGNQTNLGNWNPGKMKMKKISDYEREITLKLKSPAKFKFTRGNWDSEAQVDGTYGNVIIKPELKKVFDFKIGNYADRYGE